MSLDPEVPEDQDAGAPEEQPPPSESAYLKIEFTPDGEVKAEADFESKNVTEQVTVIGFTVGPAITLAAGSLSDGSTWTTPAVAVIQLVAGGLIAYVTLRPRPQQA
jgi:hypothetical protein